MVIKLAKTITMLNSQNNIILLLFQTHNPPQLAGIFNTLFASSSSTPILHLHLQYPFGIFNTPFCIFIFNTHLALSRNTPFCIINLYDTMHQSPQSPTTPTTTLPCHGSIKHPCNTNG
jgi:hypothetical protein